MSDLAGCCGWYLGDSVVAGYARRHGWVTDGAG